ncbi:unnamed protein product [Arctogadus glacialis]
MGICPIVIRARDYKASSAGPDLSNKQLRDVAKTLGQKWEQVGLHLGLKNEDLDKIKKEKKELMQSRNMLRLWKRQRPGKATAQDLLRGLEDMKDLPVETRRLLEDLLSKVERCHIDACAEIDEDDKVDEEEMHFKSHCEKCKAAQQSPEYEKVTPTKISKWSFEVQLEGEGTYECSATGLVFEVSEQALVRYSVLSWFQFAEFLHNFWRPAGSIYDVDVVDKDPSVLKFIHFPHSLCLAEPLHELSFSVLHVKERHANIESTVDFTASHVKWRVSSLSLLGLILSRFLSIWNWKHHGLVLIYKELNKKDFIYQVYLGSNSDSEIKLKARKNGIKITGTCKHLTCRLEEKFYCLESEPEGQIEPTNLEFTTAVLGLKGFFRVRFRKLPPFRLFLKDSLINKPLPFLIFTIEEDDWHSEEKPEVTSDLPSSPRLSLEHPAGQATSSTTSSPPAPSSESQPAGQATSSTTSSPPAPSRATQAEDLKRIRAQFVPSVSNPLIQGLLDDLFDQGVFSTEERASVTEDNSNTAGRARCVIDMVMGKGEEPSRIMIASMLKRDSFLCSKLRLIDPAPSSESQPAGQATSSTTPSPPAPSRATQAEGAEENESHMHAVSSSETNTPESAPQLPQATEEDEEDTPYPMKAQPKGYCLIVNNFDFSRSGRKLDQRIGTDIDEELGRIRSKLIDRMSDDDVIDLLYYLRKMDVLNDDEMKTVEEKMTSKDRARCLIDTVMEKGERESSLMVDYLKERRPDLCSALGLTPTSARIRFGRSQELFSRKERPGLMSPSLPLKMHEGDSELELGRIRSKLIDRMSDDDVINLLHYLRKMDVLNDDEMKTVEGKMTSKDRARCLIDTVMRKGERESRLIVDYLKEWHSDQRSTLDLTPTSALIKLGRIRSKLIDRMSDDDVIDLLYYLRKMDVLNDDEMKTVEEKMTSKDRARCLIDTVMEKGERESSLMVDYLKERRPDLCSALGLTPTSARIRFGRSQELFSRKERPGLMSPSLPLKMHEGDSELARNHSHMGTRAAMAQPTTI